MINENSPECFEMCWIVIIISRRRTFNAKTLLSKRLSRSALDYFSRWNCTEQKKKIILTNQIAFIQFICWTVLLVFIMCRSASYREIHWFCCVYCCAQAIALFQFWWRENLLSLELLLIFFFSKEVKGVYLWYSFVIETATTIIIQVNTIPCTFCVFFHFYTIFFYDLWNIFFETDSVICVSFDVKSWKKKKNTLPFLPIKRYTFA